MASLWLAHNAFKCCWNLFMLVELALRHRDVGGWFVLSNAYELVADPTVMLWTRKRNLGLSLLGISFHHIATLAWSVWIRGVPPARLHVAIVVAARSLIYMSVFGLRGLRLVGVAQLSLLMLSCYREVFFFEPTDARYFPVFASELLFLKLILACQCASLLMAKVGIVAVYRAVGCDVPVLYPLWAPRL